MGARADTVTGSRARDMAPTARDTVTSSKAASPDSVSRWGDPATFINFEKKDAFV
jgi:hypothetical protein